MIDESIANAIGLKPSWPSVVLPETSMDHEGHLAWAESYFRAAESLLSMNDEELPLTSETRPPSLFYCGPVMQMAGLSTELTLKCLLRGAGASEASLKKFSHNTYDAYCAARQHFDEVRFTNLVSLNTQHLRLPGIIQEKHKKIGDLDPDQAWRIYFNHLRIMDGLYDRPYRNRYAIPGEISAPEIAIVLVGTLVLLTAMKERITSS